MLRLINVYFSGILGFKHYPVLKFIRYPIPDYVKKGQFLHTGMRQTQKRQV